jgi:hypothetical protein
MYRIEQKLDIQSDALPPLVPLHDPFELYDEACVEFYGESSPHPHGKTNLPPKHVADTPKDEEYHEEGDDDDDDDDDSVV